MPQRPNILLITTDEERFNLPDSPGYVLPARERIKERGVEFANYYTASAQCSSARSVIYTGRHVPITRIYDNDNFPYIEPLDPALGTLGTMLGAGGLLLHLQGQVAPLQRLRGPGEPGIDRRRSRALRVPRMERLGGHRWRSLGRAPRRPGHRWASGIVVAHPGGRCLDGSAVVHDSEFRQPPRHHELRLRGRSSVQLPPNLAHATVVKPPADIPMYSAPVGLRGADELG